jgi:hypothetical protein
MATGKALDARGGQLVQLFYYVHSGGFLLLTFECGKCDIVLFPELPLLETVEGKISHQQETSNVNRNSVKQILIGQRIL